ncbi:glycosyltransferase family 4 protein [Thermovenabulum sp.]|uniref:glycosyltransferase family 4 protein n=1 Tax=Thermovenabulum sp. TaxID=3100335 RepID=UPI003C7A0AA8
MNIGIVSTFFPRECGLASFSKDLCDNLRLHQQEVKIIAMTDKNSSYDYTRDVIFEIHEEAEDDYIIAAEVVNASNLDILLLQHEYGIFGGPDGVHILKFCENLNKPYLLTTHTVLPHPTFMQKEILCELAGMSKAVICMTKRSAELLNEVYGVPLNKIYIIPHGVPKFEKKDRNKLKEKYGILGRPVITTFGFIGPGKGIEIGILAVNKLKEKFKNIIYIVAGETHPKLKKKEGEIYRESLLKLVDQLDLRDNVHFINKYIPLEELGDLLYMTDVYLTPYPGRHQAVSGTLSYALGSGRAIVSTPYEYSLEMLKNDRGLVSSCADPNELALLMDKVLSDELLKAKLEKNAGKLGETMLWPNVAKNYIEIMEELLGVKLKRSAAEDV